MFNYITVGFPNSMLAAPTMVYEASFYQNLYQHEVLSVKFRDWNIRYDAVKTGSPVTATLKSLNKSRDFYGYVHSINVERKTGYAVKIGRAHV